MAQEFALCLPLMLARHVCPEPRRALPPPTKACRLSLLFSFTSKSFTASCVHDRNAANSFPFMHLRTAFIGTEGWGGSEGSHFKYHLRSGSRPSYPLTRAAANPFICHNSGKSPVSEHPTRMRVLSERSESKDLNTPPSPLFATHPRDRRLTPIIATDPKTPFRNSFACHTYDPLPPFPIQGKQDDKERAGQAPPLQGRMQRLLLLWVPGWLGILRVLRLLGIWIGGILAGLLAPLSLKKTRHYKADSIHRVSGGLPRLHPAFQHRDVLKALLLIFRCLTGSGGFGRSRSIENDFLRLWQRLHPRLEASERHGAFQIERPTLCFVLVGADQESFACLYLRVGLLRADSLDVRHCSSMPVNLPATAVGDFGAAVVGFADSGAGSRDFVPRVVGQTDSALLAGRWVDQSAGRRGRFRFAGRPGPCRRYLSRDPR